MEKYKFNFKRRKFKRIGSVIHFYHLIGLDINGLDVRQIRGNPDDCGRIKDIMLATHLKYNVHFSGKDMASFKVSFTKPQFLNERHVKTRVGMDWLNFIPVSDSTVPRGEIHVDR